MNVGPLQTLVTKQVLKVSTSGVPGHDEYV